MSDILSAVQDDIDEYVALCKEYRARVRTMPTAQNIQLPDCYGEHAQKLKEWEMKRQAIRARALAKLTIKEKKVLGLWHH